MPITKARRAFPKIPRRASQISALRRKIKPFRKKSKAQTGKRIAEPFKKRIPFSSKTKRIGISILKGAITGAILGRIARKGTRVAKRAKIPKKLREAIRGATAGAKIGGLFKHGFVPKIRKKLKRK